MFGIKISWPRLLPQSWELGEEGEKGGGREGSRNRHSVCILGLPAGALVRAGEGGPCRSCCWGPAGLLGCEGRMSSPGSSEASQLLPTLPCSPYLLSGYLCSSSSGCEPGSAGPLSHPVWPCCASWQDGQLPMRKAFWVPSQGLQRPRGPCGSGRCASSSPASQASLLPGGPQGWTLHPHCRKSAGLKGELATWAMNRPTLLSLRGPWRSVPGACTDLGEVGHQGALSRPGS